MAAPNLTPGAKVGEPEAGRGAIALAAAEVVGRENVDCTEAMPRNAKILRDLGFTVHEGDFLQRQPERIWDLVLMNPPFSNHQDAEHIAHALQFLKPGGRLVAVASTSWRHTATRKAKVFQQLLAAHRAEVIDIPAGAFRESGTDVATVLIAMTAPAEVQTVSVTNSQPSVGNRSGVPARQPAREVEQFSLDLFEA